MGSRKNPRSPYEAGIERDAGESGVDAERRAEIEAVGMRVAMEYELSQGWVPEDVSSENHGFDVRSTLFDEDGSFIDIRYIEVKARAQTGAIRLSANEWKKARHFGEKFWLYIVTQAGSVGPELTRLIDPAEKFTVDLDIFSTGYIVPEENWKNLGAR